MRIISLKLKIVTLITFIYEYQNIMLVRSDFEKTTNVWA